VGAVPVRAPAYTTSIGLPPMDCLMERDMLERGAIAAIAFSSQAEVCVRAAWAIQRDRDSSAAPPQPSPSAARRRYSHSWWHA
jgi:hypothetical protein